MKTTLIEATLEAATYLAVVLIAAMLVAGIAHRQGTACRDHEALQTAHAAP